MLGLVTRRSICPCNVTGAARSRAARTERMAFFILITLENMLFEFVPEEVKISTLICAPKARRKLDRGVTPGSDENGNHGTKNFFP